MGGGGGGRVIFPIMVFKSSYKIHLTQIEFQLEAQ